MCDAGETAATWFQAARHSRQTLKCSEGPHWVHPSLDHFQILRPSLTMVHPTASIAPPASWLLHNDASHDMSTVSSDGRPLSCAASRKWQLFQAITASAKFSIQIHAWGACRHLMVGLAPLHAHSTSDMAGLHLDLRTGRVLWSPEHTTTLMSSEAAFHAANGFVDGDILTMAMDPSDAGQLLFWRNGVQMDLIVRHDANVCDWVPTVAFKGNGSSSSLGAMPTQVSLLA
ncbi:Aste57867_10163 [Aphanomyces stellatus]|uniref:Aste57867_10163 protein n=1 Tax=Aphanomyces stellatus TaxID=120398 RepID=A0A485KPP3_9STRA|nr:hypothetical protein As57867_010124 [Aphanomyces stellatus]VFT87039.1 Aste57867_10163 [Aphanomyces stellatus]